MSQATRRVDQFIENCVPVHVLFYPTLVECAFSELCLSLEERRGNVVRLENNHFSMHAVGSIVLLVTALDCFLNEQILVLGAFDKDIRKIANKRGTTDKYYSIIETLGGKISKSSDLDTIIKLRNEIVHFLPRNASESKGRRYLAKEFNRLYNEGYFYNPGNDKIDTPFEWLVCSYRLAYWVWENIDIAVKNFVEAFSTTKCPDHVNYSYKYLTFEKYMYERIISPDDLPTYDASFGLELAR